VLTFKIKSHTVTLAYTSAIYLHLWSHSPLHYCSSIPVHTVPQDYFIGTRTSFPLHCS